MIIHDQFYWPSLFLVQFSETNFHTEIFWAEQWTFLRILFSLVFSVLWESRNIFSHPDFSVLNSWIKFGYLRINLNPGLKTDNEVYLVWSWTHSARLGDDLYRFTRWLILDSGLYLLFTDIVSLWLLSK